MRSYTTRRSQPMMRSRLRSPTSKSMTAVLCPRNARPDAKLALVVVLPTPPLPEVTTTILAMFARFLKDWRAKKRGPVSYRLDEDFFAVETHLGGAGRHVPREVR